MPENIAGQVRMNLDLLNRLTLAVAANEKAQRRFRTAMLVRVSTIETIVKMIHGAQIAQSHDRSNSEVMKEHAKDADEYISRVSHEMGLAMVSYIYDESSETEVRRGRKRQWSDWEI